MALAKIAGDMGCKINYVMFCCEEKIRKGVPKDHAFYKKISCPLNHSNLSYEMI
jgi:hypothetical protein